LVVGVLILAVGWVGAGCSVGSFLNPGELNSPTETASTQPATDIQNSPIPESTPTVPDFPLEPWGQIQQSYSFEYLCEPYTISLPLYQSSYKYFQSQDKYFYYQGELPDDWQRQFYLTFLTSNYDQETVMGLIDEVGRAIGQDGDELVMALVNLVQNLTYDCEKLFSFDQLGGAGNQTNYPYETLYTRTGVCRDTSLLLGKILQELGYGAAFLIYEQNNHMALGIQCPVSLATYVEDLIGYCYIETTGPSRIGVVPSNIGGRDFTEDPDVIPVAKGKSFARMITLAEEMDVEVIRYGAKILQLATCQEIQLYQEIVVRQANIQTSEGQLANLKIAMDNAYQAFQEELELYETMDCEGILPPAQYEACLAQYEIVEEKLAAYDESVNEYNQVIDRINGEVYRLNLAINTFNSLMEAKDQNCTAVFSERIIMPEESE
jgi:hypothetical protein